MSPTLIWYKRSLGDPLPKLFKLFWLVEKHGGQGAQLVFFLYFQYYSKTVVRETNLEFVVDFDLSVIFLYK